MLARSLCTVHRPVKLVTGSPIYKKRTLLITHSFVFGVASRQVAGCHVGYINVIMCKVM